MKLLNWYDLVHCYYKRILFLSVPNVCNAKCPFCFLKPSYAKGATLSDSVLGRTSDFVDVAKSVGFNEFRITGGEPLVFDNLSELLSIFKEQQISYTLLTNGLVLHKYLEFFECNIPKKITVSYHSKKYNSDIFGIEYNTDLLDKNIRILCERKIDLTVSILFLEQNQEDVLTHALHLKSLGVKSIKLIYPNYKKIKMNLKSAFTETIELVTAISGIDVRYSELGTCTCAMVNRGFLSFSPSQNKLYSCCNAISDKNFISDLNSHDSLTTALWNFYNAAQVLKGFPCESHVDFCPIALNN